MNGRKLCVLVRAIVTVALMSAGSVVSAESPDLVERIFAQRTQPGLSLPVDWKQDEGAKLLVSLQTPEVPGVVTAIQRIAFVDADHAPWGITDWKEVQMLLAHEGGAGNQGAWFVPEEQEYPPVGASAKAGPGGDVSCVELFFVRLCESADVYEGGPCDAADVGVNYLVTNQGDADFAFQVGLAGFSK